MISNKQQLGIALVGLGEYATDQLIPALKETKSCYLAGVVSGDSNKRDQYRKEFGLKESNVFSYDDFDKIADSEDIDIVYIVLPNSMHAEYAIRAANAGKHVICEKPMAMNADECHRMLEACEQHGVRLSIGYRLHFDPFNKEMMRLGQEQVFGKIRSITLLDSQVEVEADQWRLDMERAGGGPLVNNGIYCVQAAIYITGELPIAVSAAFTPKTAPEKFREIEEGITWTMFFESGAVANCETSYSKDQNLMRVEAENGWFELQPAYEYNGLKGRTSEGEMKISPVNQQAKQMDDFAECVLQGRETKVPGEMGLRDVQILQAIYESARTGEKIALDLTEFSTLDEK